MSNKLDVHFSSCGLTWYKLRYYWEFPSQAPLINNNTPLHCYNSSDICYIMLTLHTAFIIKPCFKGKSSQDDLKVFFQFFPCPLKFSKLLSYPFSTEVVLGLVWGQLLTSYSFLHRQLAWPREAGSRLAEVQHFGLEQVKCWGWGLIQLYKIKLVFKQVSDGCSGVWSKLLAGSEFF